MTLSIIVLMFLVNVLSETISDDVETQVNNGTILSRKKRYLVFPKGSSLQLVIESVVPIIDYPDIFTYGLTASLAWQLPDEPYKDFKKIAKNENNSSRRVDKEHNTYDWKLQNSQRPAEFEQYYGNELQNRYPLVASWSNIANRFRLKKPSYQSTSGYYKKNSNYYNGLYPSNRIYQNRESLRQVYREVHRRTRRNLFAKIENFFTAQKKDGKACLLKAVCEINKLADGEGLFLDEIIKTIFRNQPSHDEADQYDYAANESHDCEEMYPTCSYK